MWRGFFFNEATNYLIKGLKNKCFPVNLAKFLGIFFSQNNSMNFQNYIYIYKAGCGKVFISSLSDKKRRV